MPVKRSWLALVRIVGPSYPVQLRPRSEGESRFTTGASIACAPRH